MNIAQSTCTLTALLGLLAAPLASADEAAIRAALAKVLPDEKPTAVQPTKIPTLFQVEIGPQVMFMTDDGRYLIDGAVIDLETRQDLAETARADARRRAVAALGDDQVVRFDAAKPSHSITVFTDIDCGYCRKLHQQIQEYNDAGISVRYLFYPRSGKGSPSYDKAISVWCADDRRAAMTDAKNGKDVPAKTCDNPVDRHMELGEGLGVRGTPAIVLDNGEMVPGYVPPKQLVQMLDRKGDVHAN